MPMNVQKPLYLVKINSKSFRSKSLPLKQRISTQYLPKYWHKLKLDQKTIKPNQEDRLCQLTTKQIDRIIDMEKIKYVLNGKKEGKEELFLDKYTEEPNKHPNVYRANFLSKVNKIAIERKIYRQQAEGFESIYGQFNPESIRRRQLQKQKQNIKYIKYYKSQTENSRFSMKQMNNKSFFNQFAISDEKSISSIDYQRSLQDFQQTLKASKQLRPSQLKRNKSIRDDKKLLCSKRWFDGMSTYYLQRKSFFDQDKGQPKNMDVEAIIQRTQVKFNPQGNVKKRRRLLDCSADRVRTENVDLSTINANSTHMITTSIQYD